MDRHDLPVAVFDSGVGGLSVLRHLAIQMPQEHFLYYGDNANAPYGTRPSAQIRELALRAADMLFDRGINALVVACNTATAAAIDLLRQKYPDEIIIGIEPAVKPAADRFPHGTVGVLATPATLREEKFHHLAEHYPSCRILPLPAPGLMELVEQGLGGSAQAEALLRPILQPCAQELDALVLGCTHYPFAVAALRRVLGDGVELFDGGLGTARETLRRLEQAGLCRSEGAGEIRFEFSHSTPQTLELCKKLMEV